MADPLAEVIRDADRGWHGLLDQGDVLMYDFHVHLAVAVEAHIVAVLDAEKAKWEERAGFWPVTETIANLRASLLGTTEEAT